MATAAGLVVALNFWAAWPGFGQAHPGAFDDERGRADVPPGPERQLLQPEGGQDDQAGAALEVAGGGVAGMVIALSRRRSDLRRPAPSESRSLAWPRSLEVARCPGRSGRAQ